MQACPKSSNPFRDPVKGNPSLSSPAFRKGQGYREILAGVVLFFGVLPLLALEENPLLFVTASLGTLMASFFGDLPLVVLPYLPLRRLVSLLSEELHLPLPSVLGIFVLGSSVAFLLTLWPGWRRFMRVLPANLCFAFSGSIGLLLFVRGLIEGGILVQGTSFPLEIGDFSHPRTLAALLGVLAAFILYGFRVKGAALFGMFVTFVFSLAKGIWSFGVPEEAAVRFAFPQVDVPGALRYGTLEAVFAVALFAFFETAGLLAGFIARVNEDFARFRRGLCFGILGSLLGTLLGAPGLLVAKESAVGFGERGRRGLAGVVCGGSLLGVFFLRRFLPVFPPFFATPALCVGGFAMMEPLSRIEFTDPCEGMGAFFALGVAAATMSLAWGVAAGILAFTVLSLVLRRGRIGHLALLPLSVLSCIFFFIG